MKRSSGGGGRRGGWNTEPGRPALAHSSLPLGTIWGTFQAFALFHSIYTPPLPSFHPLGGIIFLWLTPTQRQEWESRLHPEQLGGKHLLTAIVSPSLGGGRDPVELCGATRPSCSLVYPPPQERGRAEHSPGPLRGIFSGSFPQGGGCCWRGSRRKGDIHPLWQHPSFLFPRSLEPGKATWLMDTVTCVPPSHLGLLLRHF